MNKEMAIAMDQWVTTQPEAKDCEQCKEKYSYCFCGEDAEQAYADTVMDLRKE
jgi:hypothetical protein